MCTVKGSDVRPGLPLASLRCPLVSAAAFAWQAWDNVHCQGVGCAPWRPSGVPPVSLGLRRFCVTGVGQCTLPGGRMYALASLWRPSGVPPVSLGLRRFCVAGVGQCKVPGGRMYALASLRRPSGVPWSPPLLRGRRGTMCTPRGSDVRPGVPLASLRCPLVSAAFAWQAWANVEWQGVGCTPWRPSGVPPVSLGLRRFCVAGVGQCALPRGPSGVSQVSLGLLRFCVASVGQCALSRGRMYALASLRRPSGVPPVYFYSSLTNRAHKQHSTGIYKI